MPKKILIPIGALLAVIVIFLMLSGITKTMNAITGDSQFRLENDIKIDESISLNAQDKPVLNTNSEAMTAQQLERFLSYNSANENVINNIVANLDYYENPQWSCFISTYAFNKIGNYERALSFLQKIEEMNTSGLTYCYLLENKQLKNKTYVINIQAEIALHRAEILFAQGKKSEAISELQKITDTTAYYGSGDIKLSYTQLANRNIENIKRGRVFITTLVHFSDAQSAQELTDSLLQLTDKASYGDYILRCTGLEYWDLPIMTPDYPGKYEYFNQQLINLPTANYALVFHGWESHPGYDLYRFRAARYSFEIINANHISYLSSLEHL